MRVRCSFHAAAPGVHPTALQTVLPNLCATHRHGKRGTHCCVWCDVCALPDRPFRDAPCRSATLCPRWEHTHTHTHTTPHHKQARTSPKCFKMSGTPTQIVLVVKKKSFPGTRCVAVLHIAMPCAMFLTARCCTSPCCARAQRSHPTAPETSSSSGSRILDMLYV